MSQQAGMLLVHKIQPLIQAAIAKGAVRKVGSEDNEELVQDTTAYAAAMLERAEEAGRPYTPSSIAFYAVQAAKSGRRSNYKGRRDALCPAAALDGNVQTVSMDDPVHGAGTEDCSEFTLHDCLAADREGPAEKAGRRLDWEAVGADLNDRQAALLEDVVSGIPPSETAKTLGVSRPRVTQLRRQTAGRIADSWHTGDAIGLAMGVPGWVWNLNAARERLACREARKVGQ